MGIILIWAFFIGKFSKQDMFDRDAMRRFRTIYLIGFSTLPAGCWSSARAAEGVEVVDVNPDGYIGIEIRWMCIRWRPGMLDRWRCA